MIDTSIYKPFNSMVLVLALLVGLIWSSTANAVCSPYAGTANFNEYYFGGDDNFLEVYIKNINTIPEADAQNWTLRVYTAQGVFTDYVLDTLGGTPTAEFCDFGSKAYITYNMQEQHGTGLPSTQSGDGVTVVLFDELGREIDYLNVCGTPGNCTIPSGVDAYYAHETGPTCNTEDNEFKLSNMGNRDVSRFPDGTGDWSESALHGGNTTYTSCTPNLAGISKISSVASAIIGTDFTFTITAINSANSSDTFTIEDTIPAGFTYVSAVATGGTVTVADPLVSWNTGTLARRGGTESLTITVTASVLGTFDNTAKVTSGCTDPDCPQDTSSVTVLAPSVDHFDINHDTTAVNCEAETITIEAHNADHTVSTAYTGLITLSTSTSRGDWSLITGADVLDNGTANDGTATYNMVAGDNGVVVLGLKDTVAETVNINVSDGTFTELTGTAAAEVGGADNDLVFSATGFSFLAGGVASTIATEIGGKASDVAPGAQVLELQAITTGPTGACEAALQGVNQIELAFECRSPATCTANQVNINGGTASNITGNALASVATYTAVDMDFGGAADSTATFVMNYPDVGEIMLYARYDLGPAPSVNYMTGNSNAFIERPFGFDVTVTGNPAAASSAGAVFTIAGTDFSAMATAKLYEAADDADLDGIPDKHDDTDPSNNSDLSNNSAALNYVENITLSAVNDQPAVNNPALAGGTTLSSFTNGSASTSTARYDEVGIIEIAANISDADYLGIGDIIGKSGYVGRFRPNNFVINSPVVTPACSSATPFNYMLENYTIDYTLQAWSADPTGADVAILTQNYVGGFAKLDPSVVGTMNFGATNDSTTDLSGRLNVGLAGAFAAGVAPVTVTINMARDADATILDGPYATFQVGIAPDDGESVTLTSFDLDLDGGGNTHGLLGSNDIRYGRLSMQDNFGSELLPVNMTLSAEYYDSTAGGFITNADDSCTTRTIADVLLYNDQEPKTGRVLGDPVIDILTGTATTTLSAIPAFVNGQTSLTFSAPGIEGFVEVEVQTPTWLLSDFDVVDQGPEGPGGHCNPALIGSGSFAEIDPCVADTNFIDDVPTSRARFGIFRGSDRIIDIREVVP